MRVGTVCVVLTLVLVGCGGAVSDPEKAVRALIEQAEMAAEQRQSGVLKEMIADDYRDGRGWDRRQVARVVHGILLRRRQVNLFTVIREVRVIEPTQVRAVVLVAMSGRPVTDAEQLAELRASLWRFEVWFKYHDSEWRVLRADWRQARLGEFLL